MPYTHGRRMFAQSAMEYLMTYGWAILIIAIVLGVLYYIGAFGNGNLTPTAQPGNCQVFRPNGPGTSYDAALSGSCNNELPEYVAQFSATAGSQVAVPSSSSLSLTTQGAVSFWIYSTPQSVSGACWISVSKWHTTSDADYVIYIAGPGCAGTWPSIGVYANAGGSWSRVSPFSQALNLNTWYNVVWTYTSSGGGYLYINGVSQGGAIGGGTLYTNTDSVKISQNNGGGNWFGSMANVQIYNTSLSANEAQALYLEGIGGAPINTQSIVAWWPLNGNPNDYSGNMNNGVATSVSYTSSWTSGYSAP